jgi:hypothetical protein
VQAAIIAIRTKITPLIRYLLHPRLKLSTYPIGNQVKTRLVIAATPGAGVIVLDCPSNPAFQMLPERPVRDCDNRLNTDDK